jgi:hypothetical protein
MPPIPAQISSSDLMNTTSVTGATNHFEMVVKAGAYFGISNPRSLDLVTKMMQNVPGDTGISMESGFHE